MTQLQNIFVKLGMGLSNTITLGNTVERRLYTTTTVSELQRIIADIEGPSVQSVRLIYGGKQLRPECKLEEYSIHDESTIHGTLRLLGGAEGTDKRFFRWDQVLKEGSTMEKTTRDCQLGISDDCSTDTIPKLKFKDNHSSYILCADCCYQNLKRSAFNLGLTKSYVNPDNSDRVLIPNVIVLRSVFLTNKEWNEFNTQLNENYFAEMKTCPKCNKYVFRADTDQFIEVNCAACRYRFCWICRGVWKGIAGKCLNANCDPLPYYLHELESCERKAIYEKTNVPSKRCCPNCFMILEHGQNCKHITCPNKECKHQYCHVCLRKWVSCCCQNCKQPKNDSNICKSSNCAVAPIQSPTLQQIRQS